MVDGRAQLDAHRKPPDALRVAFKRLQKLRSRDLDADYGVIGFRRELTKGQEDQIVETGMFTAPTLNTALACFDQYVFHGMSASQTAGARVVDDVPIYDISDIPGKLGVLFLIV